MLMLRFLQYYYKCLNCHKTNILHTIVNQIVISQYTEHLKKCSFEVFNLAFYFLNEYK